MELRIFFEVDERTSLGLGDRSLALVCLFEDGRGG